MSPKSLALVAASVAVMAMGVYLLVQVKSSPAQAQARAEATAMARPSHVPERAAETAPQVGTPTAAPATASAARFTPPPQHAAPSAAEAPALPDEALEEAQRANPRFDAMMDLANKAYDAQDFDQATAIAGKVLAKDPSNVRMLRIMVSANCIAGDASVAQQYYEKLPKPDRDQMKVRCDRYQVALTDPA